MKSLRLLCGLVCVVVFLLFLGVGWLLRSQYVQENLQMKHMQEHQALVSVFGRTIWLDYQKNEADCAANRNRECPSLGILRDQTRMYFTSGVPKSYSYVLYTKTGTILAKNPTLNAPLFDAIPDAEFFTFNEQAFTAHILPAQEKKYEDVLLLLGSKLVPLHKRGLLWGALGGGLIVLLSLFGWLYVMVLRAEKEVSHHYAASQNLLSAKQLAEDENRQKSQFLANVSHELRTPLNAIIGFSEIIKDEVMGPMQNDQYKEYMHDIHNSGVHLLSLINDILDYSKAEAGKLDVRLEEVDVTKLLRNALRLMEPKAAEQGVDLRNEMTGRHVLNTDSKRLKQVLLNVLSNAVKFTPKGGVVALSCWRDIKRKRLVIEVKDTGVGIAEQDISKVMSTFGQVENKLSRRHEGTGLGLPLSKRLVELISGEFSIKSKLNEGTVVSVSLPAEGMLPQEDPA